ncbi:hypothetical protein GCM10012275_64700 [Longimycelium tulufanense]|uniref:Uncharacterized protein n=1 Tax=Longimycelium tulufanense TaxID=907463 RepID=A0A8J3CF57_9PSEU|nr:hypothetical protein [Longimycelium tulufanense]GGM84988.1 hypothetical protein GCM10012275_64700 [Longimycelium tulufanense]
MSARDIKAGQRVRITRTYTDWRGTTRHEFQGIIRSATPVPTGWAVMFDDPQVRSSSLHIGTVRGSGWELVTTATVLNEPAGGAR